MINLMNGIRVNELLKLNEYDLNKLQEYCFNITCYGGNS